MIFYHILLFSANREKSKDGGKFAALAYSKNQFFVGQILERIKKGEEDVDEISEDEMFVEKPD